MGSLPTKLGASPHVQAIGLQTRAEVEAKAEAEVEAGMEIVVDVGGSSLVDQPRLCEASKVSM